MPPINCAGNAILHSQAKTEKLACNIEKTIVCIMNLLPSLIHRLSLVFLHVTLKTEGASLGTRLSVTPPYLFLSPHNIMLILVGFKLIVWS